MEESLLAESMRGRYKNYQCYDMLSDVLKSLGIDKDRRNSFVRQLALWYGLSDFTYSSLRKLKSHVGNIRQSKYQARAWVDYMMISSLYSKISAVVGCYEDMGYDQNPSATWESSLG